MYYKIGTLICMEGNYSYKFLESWNQIIQKMKNKKVIGMFKKKFILFGINIL